MCKIMWNIGLIYIYFIGQQGKPYIKAFDRIGPKLIPWMYLKSVLVKFEDGWPWPIFEVTGVNLNMKIFNFRL